MPRLIILWILVAMMPVAACCQQDRLARLKELVLRSDSVFLVSHKMLGAVITEGNRKRHTKLIDKNKIDQSLVIKKIAIGRTDRDTLAALLTQPNMDRTIETAKCFLPAHAIVFLNKKRYSFIEICFTCQRIQTSNDITLTESDFSRNKWTEIKRFFKNKGIGIDQSLIPAQ